MRSKKGWTPENCGKVDRGVVQARPPPQGKGGLDTPHPHHLLRPKWPFPNIPGFTIWPLWLVWICVTWNNWSAENIPPFEIPPGPFPIKMPHKIEYSFPLHIKYPSFSWTDFLKGILWGILYHHIWGILYPKQSGSVQPGNRRFYLNIIGGMMEGGKWNMLL